MSPLLVMFSEPSVWPSDNNPSSALPRILLSIPQRFTGGGEDEQKSPPTADSVVGPRTVGAKQ